MYIILYLDSKNLLFNKDLIRCKQILIIEIFSCLCLQINQNNKNSHLLFYKQEFLLFYLIFCYNIIIILPKRYYSINNFSTVPNFLEWVTLLSELPSHINDDIPPILLVGSNLPVSIALYPKIPFPVNRLATTCLAKI